MKVDLSKLFDNQGETQEFSAALDLGDVRRWGSGLFHQPVRIAGIARNRAEIVDVGYTVDFVLETVCDRCLTPLTRPGHQEFSHTVVLSLNREDNDEYIVIPDGKLDLAELATSDILLELPTSILCGDDCRGLCPKCGANLNEGECGCDRTERDPRLDKLRELLKD